MLWMLRFCLHIILLSPVFLNAQISIINRSLTDTTQNIFYLGVDNIITISGKQYDPVKQHTVIMGGGGTLHKMEKGVYAVRVQEETDNCQVWITENNKPVFKQIIIAEKSKEMQLRGLPV